MAAKLSEKVHNAKQIVTFEQAITMTGYGAFNIYVLLATGLCLMCVIIETMCMMFIIPAAQCDLHLSLSEKGLLSSISFFGVVSSSHLWGYIADTKGRRMVLVISLTISSISTLICSFIAWDWLFILLRYINGFFIGGASSIVYAYAGEFHNDRYRPKVISWMSTFVALGNMFLPGSAWIILPEEWRYEIPFLAIFFRPWRLLLMIYAIPSMICALVLYCLPESPKYLCTKGQRDEAMCILKKMYSVNFRRSKDDYPVENVIWDELGDVDEKKYGILQSIWRQTVPLFKGELLIKTLMMCFMQFGIFASNSGIAMWYPEILNAMSHYAADRPNEDISLCRSVLFEEEEEETILNMTRAFSNKICNDTVKTEVFLISLMIALAYACMYIVIGIVINICGKKNLMIGFVAVTTISGICSQYVYGYNLIQFLIGLFLMGGTGIGITNAIAVDLFPTQVRGMAMAVSLMCGRIGAMTGTNLVGPLVYNFCDYLFYVVTADHVLLIIVVALLPSSQKLPKLVQ